MVGYAVGLSDLTGAAWSALGGTTDFPDSRAGVSQALMVLGLGGDDPVPRFLWEGNGHAPPRSRIIARVRDEGAVPTLALVDAIKDKAATLFGPLGGQVSVTGVAYLAQRINATLTRQFSGSFAIAVLLIGGVWFAATRSIRRTTTALIPNILPLLLLLGTLGLLGLALKPSTAMVLSIGLGIAVDDTIHFLTAYERARGPGVTTREAILSSYRTAGRSMVDTSLVLVTGFALLGISSFPATATFGMLTGWTILMALLVDLVVLGPLILLLERRSSG